MTHPTRNQQHQAHQLIFNVTTVMLQIHLMHLVLLLVAGIFIKIGLVGY